MTESKTIVKELENSAGALSEDTLSGLIEKIRGHERIFVYGTGRSGLMLKAFAMRLMQMGFTAYVVGETTTPSVGKGDLLVVASASGETGSVNLTARSARDQGVELLVISAQPDSTLAGIQKPDVLIDAGTKFSHSASSIQPLGRNTVVNDCKMVDTFLKEYQITFVSRSKLGIKAVANAAQRQNLLIGIFSQSLLPLQDSEPFFARFLAKKMGFVYPFSDITRHMLSYAHEHGLFFAKETAGLLAVNAFVLLNDRRGAAAADSPQALDSVGCMLDYAARQLNCPVERGEIAAMEKVIFQRDLRPQIQSINDFELYGVISHFVFRVGQAVGTDIQHDDLLVKSLLLHMKNVKNWGETFEFELDGCFPNIALVQKSVAENCCILENYLHYKMNQNMRDGIVVHICAAICRCQTTMRPSRVIISCPGSMATSKYLEAQVRSYFNLQIEGVTESRKLENCAVDLSGIDFVISTVQIRSPLPSSARC